MPNLMQRLLSNISLPRMRPFREMGVGGTAVFGGYIQTIERNAGWVGRQRYITSSEILTNVSIVAASIHYFLNVVSRPAWSVVPANDTPEAQKYAEFVDEVITKLATPWPRVIRRATTYRLHGFSIQEWTAQRRDDGKTGLIDIEPRPQHTIEQWVVADNGSVEGMWQRSPQTNQMLGLPRGKVVYLVDDTLSDSPEGMGALRHMAEPYNRLKQFLALETRAFERDLRGTPVGRAPLTLIQEAVTAGKITEAQATELIQGMKDFVEIQVKQSNTGMLLDSMPYESEAADGRKVSGLPQWSMELLQGASNGLPELHAAIDRVQREMARILGTESLMLGETAGSRALSQDKSKNLYLTANSVLSNIVAAMTADIIGPLWTLNGFPEELKPEFQAEDVTPQDVGEVTAALRDMATAGAVLAPDDPVIDDVRDLLGVSRQPERDEADLDMMVRSKTGLQNAERMEQELAGEGKEKDKKDRDELDKLLKFDPNQPRHPKGDPRGGQWRDSDGAASTAEEGEKPEDGKPPRAAELLNRNWEPIDEASFINSLPPEIVDKINWAESALAQGVRTTALPEEGGFLNADGTWTLERQQLHEQILDEFFNESAVRAATPAEGESPEFVMLGGRPGAGKTTALMRGDFTLDRSKFLTINADEFQEKLPGYQGHLAGLFNQEGQYLAEVAERIARQNKLNVIYDATLKSTQPALQRVSQLKQEGYKVSAFFVHVSPRNSAVRAMINRFANGTGRYVPAQVLLNAVTNEQTFDRIAPLVDRWALYDGNGNGPKLIGIGGNSGT